jgi:hypothetical protein
MSIEVSAEAEAEAAVVGVAGWNSAGGADVFLLSGWNVPTTSKQSNSAQPAMHHENSADGGTCSNSTWSTAACVWHAAAYPVDGGAVTTPSSAGQTMKTVALQLNCWSALVMNRKLEV